MVECNYQGLAQLVARTSGGREVASSSLVALTRINLEIWNYFMIKITPPPKNRSLRLGLAIFGMLVGNFWGFSNSTFATLSNAQLDFFETNGIYYYDPSSGGCEEDDVIAKIDGAATANLSAQQVGFVKTYHDMAVKLAIEFGIPWEDILAQGINESTAGTSRFARERNNFFGVGAYRSNPDHAYYYKSARDGFIGMFQNFITTTASPSYIDSGAFDVNSKNGNAVTDPNAFLLSIAPVYNALDDHGKTYINLIAPLINGIQKLSEKEGWESSAKLAESHPEMLANAAAIKSKKKSPYKSFGSGTSVSPFRYEFKGLTGGNKDNTDAGNDDATDTSTQDDICGVGAGGGNGDINKTAIALSWPERQQGDWRSQPVVPEYKKALKQVGLTTYGDDAVKVGASCDAFVATVMRYSGADKKFYCCGASSVLNYLSGSDKYEEIPNLGNTSNLKPGDIRSRSGHVELVVQLDNGEWKIASASYRDRTSDHSRGYYPSSEYKVFRLKSGGGTDDDE